MFLIFKSASKISGRFIKDYEGQFKNYYYIIGKSPN